MSRLLLPALMALAPGLLAAQAPAPGPSRRPAWEWSNDTIQRVVSYFQHAAQGLEERKQILYLLGPVGGGKSSLAERLKIQQVLREADNNKGRAAELLQITYKMLLSKVKEHRLE